MSIFSRFFRKEPTPDERVRQWISATRTDIISTAETRLGRALRPEEMKGVERIQSMMMLESFQREVASEKSTPEQIEQSLAHFASDATKVKYAANRVAGSDWLPAPTPPSVRVQPSPKATADVAVLGGSDLITVSFQGSPMLPYSTSSGQGSDRRSTGSAGWGRLVDPAISFVSAAGCLLRQR